MTIATMVVLAAVVRGRLLQRLIEGDPVAWGILGVCVAGAVVIGIVKKKMRGD